MLILKTTLEGNQKIYRFEFTNLKSFKTSSISEIKGRKTVER